MKHTLAVSLFLTILAGNTTGNAMARNTTISGVAPSYAGKTISLRTYAEQVLNEEEELAQAKVEKDGAFKFEVNIDSPIQVFIPNDVTKAFIYLEPGATYDITLPDYQERTLPEKLNPYFKPSDVLAPINNLKRGDFNYQMMEFEDAFDFYTMKHITYGAHPDSVKKSIGQLKAMFTDLKNPYQVRFKEYRYALLHNMCVTNHQQQLDSVIIRLNNIGVDYENPAFWDAFNNIFVDFIRNSSGSEEYELFKRIVATNDAKMLMRMLGERYKISVKLLRELAAIKIVGELVEFPVFDRSQIIVMLQSLGSVISDQGNRELLQAMINKVSVNYIGTPAPDFEARDTNGNLIKLSDFRGKFVYLNFGNSNLEKTIRDLQVLRRFHDSYQNSLVIMNVFLFDDVETVKRLEKVHQKQMLFLTTPVSDAVRHAYDLKNTPSYLLIDKEGNFLMTKGTEPNDELRLFLQNTLNLK